MNSMQALSNALQTPPHAKLRVHYSLFDNVIAMERDAATLLSDSFSAARLRLQEAATDPACSPPRLAWLNLLIPLLEPLDRAKLDAAKRGNVRRLCASLRILGEAFYHLLGPSKTQELWPKVKWAAHSPLSSTKCELAAAQERIEEYKGEWEGVKHQVITASEVGDLAPLLQRLVDDLLCPTAPPLAMETMPLLHCAVPLDGGGAKLWAAVKALGASCGESRGRLEALRDARAARGEGAISAAVELLPHIPLLTLAFEAAEHLKAPRELAAWDDVSAEAELRRLALGLRLFAGALENALFTLRGGAAGAYRRSVLLRKLTNFSAHFATHTNFSKHGKWSESADITASSVEELRRCLEDLVGALEQQLELVAVVEARGGGGGDDDSSWGQWGWALWVALELADVTCDKEKKPIDCGPFHVRGAQFRFTRLPFLRLALDGLGRYRDEGLGSAEEILFCQRAELKAQREMKYHFTGKQFADAGVTEEEKARALECIDRFNDNATVRNGSMLLPNLRVKAQLHFTRQLGAARVDMNEVL